MRRLLWALLALSFAATAAEQYDKPHLVTGEGTHTLISHGQRYTDLGLVGTGRLSAQTLDFMGDTLGSFSSLGFAPGHWRRVGDTYEGVLWTLPDRGRNDPAAGLFYDYPARLQRFRLRFTPGTAQAGPNQSSQFELVPAGGLLLRDFRGEPFTGADPGSGIQLQHGLPLPSPQHGVGQGKISIDAESLQFRKDGSFYIGDEYSAAIFYFNAKGQLQGIIPAPAAVAPQRAGKLDFSSLHPPTSGRRNNQGLEGLALTPDGYYLLAALQSALVQDSASGPANGRIHTRIFVYAVDKQATPARPLAEYLVQLPSFTAKGDGGPVDQVAAQSEILALDAHRLLMLARDGNGLGNMDGAPIVYKSILLIDTEGASNLLDSRYDQPGVSVLQRPDATRLAAGLVPAHSQELVNLLDPRALARFKLRLDHDVQQPSRQLSAKWEAMDLVPALDPSRPWDYFLFVGNDNDFIARHCRMQGQACDSSFDNDNRLLVYRLTMPGLQWPPAAVVSHRTSSPADSP